MMDVNNMPLSEHGSWPVFTHQLPSFHPQSSAELSLGQEAFPEP
jgi:hypothetical protein